MDVIVLCVGKCCDGVWCCPMRFGVGGRFGRGSFEFCVSVRRSHSNVRLYPYPRKQSVVLHTYTCVRRKSTEVPKTQHSLQLPEARLIVHFDWVIGPKLLISKESFDIRTPKSLQPGHENAVWPERKQHVIDTANLRYRHRHKWAWCSSDWRSDIMGSFHTQKSEEVWFDFLKRSTVQIRSWWVRIPKHIIWRIFVDPLIPKTSYVVVAWLHCLLYFPQTCPLLLSLLGLWRSANTVAV